MALRNLARVYSAELEGVNARAIEVEVDMNVGLHSFNIVGLADKALNEARERVNSALKNSGAKPPNRENRRITINLAPADVQKTGSQYDLAIALGYLLASKQIAAFDGGNKLFVGELALDGRLRPINGALNIAEMARGLGFEFLFLPKASALEAAAIDGLQIIPAEKLSEVITHLEGRQGIAPIKESAQITPRTETVAAFPDFTEVLGQSNAKRALTIAAAGNHNCVLLGPPGVGKSMLARALIGILPALTRTEAIEVTKIWSAAGLGTGRLMEERPFRAPHQTTSLVALIGGGQESRPGEISLAHRGVLFLDELPEFPRRALEALREPLEAGIIHIGRAKRTLAYPARFALIAALNPCPCGYYGDPDRECKCAAYEILKYRKKISGPLLDRIDLRIKLGRVQMAELGAGERRPAVSPEIKRSVERARAVQARRFAQWKISTNAEMSSGEAQAMALLEPGAQQFLRTFNDSRLSPRGYFRILKVARTIADLEGKERVAAEHLAEALSYRPREAADD